MPGWTNSANIDMIAIYMTGLATIVLLLVPFIPGLRDIPRLIPVHRLIWRSPSGPAPRSADGGGPDGGTGTGTAAAAAKPSSAVDVTAAGTSRRGEAGQPEAPPTEPRP